MIPPEVRFERYVDRSAGPDACHPWTGALNEFGYGRFYVGPGVKPLAHRFAWQQANGPIPDGAHVDHVCHNGTGCPGGPSCPHRRCCNDRHLDATTPADNNDRAHTWVGHRTHCAREGHPLSGDNVYVNPRGWRQCRTCRRADEARRRVGVRS